jgi:hypothetical protein
MLDEQRRELLRKADADYEERVKFLDEQRRQLLGESKET